MQASKPKENNARYFFINVLVLKWMKGLLLLAFFLGLLLYTIGIPKSLASYVFELPERNGLQVEYAYVKWKIDGWEFVEVRMHDIEAELTLEINSLQLRTFNYQAGSVIKPLRIEIKEAFIQTSAGEVPSSWMIDSIAFDLHKQKVKWVCSNGRLTSGYATLAFEGILEEGLTLSSSLKKDYPFSFSVPLASFLNLQALNSLSGEIYFSLFNEESGSKLEWGGTLVGMVDGVEICLEGQYDPYANLMEVVCSHQIGGFDITECLSDDLNGWLDHKGIEQLTFDPFSVRISLNGLQNQMDLNFEKLGTVEINTDHYDISEMSVHKIGPTWFFSMSLCTQEQGVHALDMAHKEIKCTGSYHQQRDNLNLEVVSTLHPHRLLRILPMTSHLRDDLQVWNASSKTPYIHITSDLFLDEDEQDISATIRGKHLSYRGVSFQDISMQIHYANDQLSLGKIEGAREQEAIQLDLVYDFSEGWMEYIGTAHLAYKELFTLLNVSTNLFQDIRVKGSPDSSFSGKFSLRDQKTEAYQFNTKIAAATWYTFMLGEGEIEMEKKEDDSINIKAQAEFLDGRISCNGRVFDSTTFNAPIFTCDWSASNVAIKQGVYGEDKKNKKQRLDASGTFMYNMHTGLFASAEGEANVTLRGEKLAELPFLAGLHELLAELLPIERWFSFDELKGSLRYKDKKFQSNRLLLSGPLMKASIKGHYDLHKGYDAIMRLQMRDDTELEKLFSVLASPFLRVFDINLEGTFDQPKWHLRKWDNLIN